MSSDNKQTDPDNLRTEYSALSAFHTSVIQFRFTLIGFYIAAVGLIVSQSNGTKNAPLLLGISIALWLLEFRNRSLMYNLSDRAMQIERQGWGYKGKAAYDPFYCHMMKARPSKEDDPEAPDPPSLDYPKFWTWKVKVPVTHTQGFDLLYCFVSIYALIQIITSRCWH